MPLVEAIFVRADSDIMSVADLKGQPMTDGYTAQNTILPQLDAFYSTAGMTRDDVEKVSVASVVAGADAFMAGDTVGFIFAHGAGKVREADAAVGGLRALGVDDDSDAALAAAREHWPTAFFKTLPAGAMPGVLEDTTYIAFPQVVFTHAGVSDDVVYAMAKAMYENAAGHGRDLPAVPRLQARGHEGRSRHRRVPSRRAEVLRRSRPELRPWPADLTITGEAGRGLSSALWRPVADVLAFAADADRDRLGDVGASADRAGPLPAAVLRGDAVLYAAAGVPDPARAARAQRARRCRGTTSHWRSCRLRWRSAMSRCAIPRWC